MPTAWEETTGTGVGTGLVSVTGVGGQTDVEWAISSDMLPDGISAYIAWSPKADGSKNNDKVVSGAASSIKGSGYDFAVSHTGIADGLELFAGYSTIEKSSEGDHNSHVLGATYAVGSVTVGYQYSDDGYDAGGTDSYTNQAFGVSFSVNDDLSISYGRNESDRSGTDSNVELVAESIQIAYSMGGATIKVAETDVDNAAEPVKYSALSTSVSATLIVAPPIEYAICIDSATSSTLESVPDLSDSLRP
jgi:hypothetical protein